MNEHHININIERSVLSSFLFDYTTFTRLKDELKPESFYLITHQGIFQSMLNLHKKDLPIDEEFIIKDINSLEFKNEALNQNLFKEQELQTALIEIMTATAITNVTSYIKEIQKNHIQRETQALALKLQHGKIEINDFKIKISKIEDLYKKDETEQAQNIEVDFKNLSPFLGNLVQDLMKINNYPVSMVLSTVLTSMAGLIGARAKITNGVNLTVFPVVWSMIVAPSSISAKSTLFRYTKKCIFNDMQNDLFDKYESDLEIYKTDMKRFTSLSREDKAREIEPERPKVKLLIFANDGTPEAKIMALSNNQNGGVVYYDEMKAELERSNNDPRYKALKTSIFDGELYHKELVKDGGTFILRNPVLSEVGLITQQWLMESVQKNDIASGFMARYLFSYNTRADFKPLQINQFIIDDKQYSEVGEFLINVLDIDRKEPLLFVLELAAKNYYVEWFNDFSRTAFATETDEEITASYRLSTYVLKFTLILYLFDMAYQKIDIIKADKLAIPLSYIKNAIYIMELFQDENHKILNLFERYKKLNFKIDDTSIKLQKKIRATEHKRLTKTEATNGIRGLTSKKLNELVDQGLFTILKIDRTTYISEP